MARDFFINGEMLVLVKGRSDSAIGSLTQFGLAADQIRVNLDFRHQDIQVNAYGGQIPPEVQFMLASATISMSMVHFDRTVLDVLLTESMAGAPAVGALPRAGSRMGNNLPRFAAGGALGNHYIGLNLTSPVGGKPWRFFYSYLTGPPMDFPLGTERSIVQLNWRAIPYTQDPWNNGSGAQGQVIWDYNNDT